MGKKSLIDGVSPNFALFCGSALIVVALLLGHDGTLVAASVGAIFGIGGIAYGKRR